MIEPNYMNKDKIYKTKDIIPLLKYYGNSFDKLKTKHENRAKAIILGYRVVSSGLSENDIRTYIGKKIEDRDITNILEFKEIKSIRSWSISSSLKKEEKELELLRTWCMKLGAICLLADITQKDIIALASGKENLDCTVPSEF